MTSPHPAYPGGVLRFLVIVALLALVTYFVVRAFQQRGALPPPKPKRKLPPPRVIGPDDDPDFLRDLDRKRRHPEDPEAPTG